MKWQSDEDLAEGLGLSQNEFNAELSRVKSQLLKVREGRIKLGLDEKILTSWNALTVSGLCDALEFQRAQTPRTSHQSPELHT